MTAFPRNGLAVIWDMDGTMVDTAELHFNAWQEMGERLQRPFSRAEFTATFGWRNPEIFREIYGNRFSDQEIAALGEQKEQLYRAAAKRQGIELLPGVRRLLEELHACGFRQAVGSSAPRANLDLILRLTSVEQFFDAVVSMEDTQRGKPDPEVFLIAAKKLGVPPQNCLVLEDAPAGVQAAHAGGMKCVAVDFAGHHSADKLVAAGADHVVRTLEEVSAAVVKQMVHAGDGRCLEVPALDVAGVGRTNGRIRRVVKHFFRGTCYILTFAGLTFFRATCYILILAGLISILRFAIVADTQEEAERLQQIKPITMLCGGGIAIAAAVALYMIDRRQNSP